MKPFETKKDARELRAYYNYPAGSYPHLMVSLYHQPAGYSYVSGQQQPGGICLKIKPCRNNQFNVSMSFLSGGIDDGCCILIEELPRFSAKKLAAHADLLDLDNEKTADCLKQLLKMGNK